MNAINKVTPGRDESMFWNDLERLRSTYPLSLQPPSDFSRGGGQRRGPAGSRKKRFVEYPSPDKYLPQVDRSTVSLASLGRFVIGNYFHSQRSICLTLFMSSKED